MFGKLKKTHPDPLATLAQECQPTLARWAAAHQFKTEALATQELRVHGSTLGLRWQLHAGRPNRPYIKGLQIKVGIKTPQPLSTYGVVCTRSTADLIQLAVYGEATDSIETNMSRDDLPQEMSWVTTMREQPLDAPWGANVACYGSPSAVIGAYASQFLCRLPGGEHAALMNTLFPWILVCAGSAVVLRTASPAVDSGSLDSTLLMLEAAIRPLRLLSVQPVD
jgi:hypothetical protein